MPNGASVDQLYIEINAKAVKANDAIDRLCGKLDRLSASLGKVNGSHLIGLANGVQRLGTAMQTMNTIKTADFTRLAKNIEKMGTINVSSINSTASAINQISKAFNNLGPVSDNAQKFSELAKGIAQLGYKSSTQAIKNIPQLAVAMKNLMATLSTAPKVSKNLIDMTNALAKLARTGASSGKAVSSLSKSFNLFSSSSQRAKISSFSLASAIGKIYASYWMLFRAFKWLKKGIDLSSALTEVQNVVDVTFGKYRNLVEEMSKTSITEFGMSELTVKEVSSRFQAMGTAMGFAQGEMANTSVELTKLAADMASFYNVDQKDVAEDLEAIFTGQTRPLRTYGLDLSQATLQEWALKNGIDANVKSMSQMEKASLRYQYVMANTGAAQGDFARTANTWANQVRILKQNFEQLGIVLGGTLINVFKPIVTALNVVIGKFIQFAKVVSDSLGKIFGWEYQETGVGGVATELEDASDASTGVSDGLGKASNNAKKLKQQLQGFDELNVLSSDKGSAGSGGSGGSGGGNVPSGDGTGGQWTKTESIFKAYESNLDTLYKLGDYIGTTITNSLNNIDWEDVYEGARNFGTGLASFLNGLISPELFGALGKTIAGSINTALNAANAFVIEFEWGEFGKSLMSSLSEFLRNWNAELTAETFSNLVGGIIEGIASFIRTGIEENVLKSLGQRLVDLICGIKWIDLVWDLAGLLTAVSSWIINAPVSMFSGITEAIAERISGLDLEIDFPKIIFDADNVFNWDFTLSLTKAAEDSFSEAWKRLKNGNIGSALFETVNGIINVAVAALAFPVEPIMDVFSEAWDDIREWWKSNIKLPSVEAPSIGDIKSKIQTAWTSAKSWWNSKPALSNITATVFNIKSALSSAWTTARNWWNKNKPSLSQITAKIKIPRLTITWSTTGAAAKALQKLGLKGFPNFSVKYYAMGGFPEDGWFRANHGELMGKFDNGRTVVANNKQITQGIAEAVYQGNRENNSLMRQELELMRRQIELLMDLVEKETGISAREVFNTVRKEAENYKRATGRTAFAL